MSSPLCVLVVADPGRIAELATALGDPFPQGAVDVLVSTGGDDTIDLFESRAPRVVVLTASLDVGDAKSLIETLRDMVPREELSIVLVGDDTGPIRNALDAIDMKPDRFVGRPLSTKALRFAVQSGLDAVARALGEPVAPTAAGSDAGAPDEAAAPVVTDAGASASRSHTNGDAPAVSRTPTSPIRGRGLEPAGGVNGSSGNGVGTNGAHAYPGGREPRDSEPTIERDVSGAPTLTRAKTDRGIGISSTTPGHGHDHDDPQRPSRAALRARWEALADSIGDDALDDDLLDDGLDADLRDLGDDSAPPLPPPIEIQPRRKGGTNPDFTPVPPMAPWRPGTTSELREEDLSAPAREPTLILHDEPPSRPSAPLPPPMASLSSSGTGASTNVTASGAAATSAPVPPGSVVTAATASGVNATSAGANGSADVGADQPPERWSHPVLLSELIDRSRDSSRELLAHVTGTDDLGGLDDIDDDVIVGQSHQTPPPRRGGKLDELEDLAEPEPPPEATQPRTTAAQRTSPGIGTPSTSPSAPAEAPPERPAGRDFARQLRAKMSMMAQRLFSSDSAEKPAVDLGPRHDHHTEIDLASLADEPPLGQGVTEIERSVVADARELTTSPGSWDTQVREKGLPDAGEIVRGVSDAAMVVARMFMQNFTGRVGFRKDDVEKVVFFDQGRPVFASSNEAGDRMGELLVREGKITASQYERCQVHVAQSGRRMGEILVDFGYLKRRELLPAVRRHVEDIIYSLFGWDRGHYHITVDPTPSAERIRLSRHPASLILEGIRRKLDRSTLERALGASSTVIEIPDRERINAIINSGDLAQEERSALAAFDGQSDLAQVARTTGIDVADVLPLAWGLVVLGLATARRAEVDVLEESTALVGETDLAIDRERVRARWQLVTEADYFALLGVRRDATAFEIRRAYQAARRDFAADCFPADLRRELARELEDIAAVLDEAFRVLRDDRLRTTYLANLVE